MNSLEENGVGMNGLNPQQMEAISYLGGPLLVLAGAGSGKTRVITQKIAYLIQQANYAPHKIAAITFTNKAAREMQERVAGLLSTEQMRGLTVCTFHSLGMRILREECSVLGYKSRFSVLDSADCLKIISELLAGVSKDVALRAQHQISLWKNQLKLPEDVLCEAENDWDKRLANVFASYQDTLQSYHCVDFDDLIVLPTLLLKTNADIRIKWQQKLRYLLVDEYQDTSMCQYHLMRLLTGLEGMFTAVGDDDQSIYRWRGADVENLRLLQCDYPQLRVIKLEQNYRSTQRILRVANHVIAHNPKLFSKTLWSDHQGEGNEIHVIKCTDEQHEADTVVDCIVMQKQTQQRQYGDFAILYRGNHQAKIFEKALRSRHIPYRLSGGQSFFDRLEIKDVLAYARLLVNIDDDPAFLRAITAPKRGIGAITLEKLNQYIQLHHCSLFQAAQSLDALTMIPTQQREHLLQFMSLIQDYRSCIDTEHAGNLLARLLKDIRYEQYLIDDETSKLGEKRWKNVQELLAWIGKKAQDEQKTLAEIVQSITLMSLLEDKNEEALNSVQLSTLHAAKGLEYPYVFLVGCEEGLFPHEDSIQEGNLDEERRLMYVGITRARYGLTITYCVKRKRAGQWQFVEPSRFISEMPPSDLRYFGRQGDQPLVSQEEGKKMLSQMLAQLRAKNSQL